MLGLLFKDEIRTGARDLWVITVALIVFSAVIAAAEHFGTQTRHAQQLTWKDSTVVGLAQCLALVPGVSRSGATVSHSMYWFVGYRVLAGALVLGLLATRVVSAI